MLNTSRLNPHSDFSPFPPPSLFSPPPPPPPLPITITTTIAATTAAVATATKVLF